MRAAIFRQIGTAVRKEVRMQFSSAYTVDDFRFVVDTLDRGAAEVKIMIDPWMGAAASRPVA